MKIEIKSAAWTQNVDAGGGFNKTLSADPRMSIKLWYLGHGVLVEQTGKPDTLVPIANVLRVSAPGRFPALIWGAAEEPTPEPLVERLPGLVASAEKRSPGRPKKGD